MLECTRFRPRFLQTSVDKRYSILLSLRLLNRVAKLLTRNDKKNEDHLNLWNLCSCNDFVLFLGVQAEEKRGESASHNGLCAAIAPAGLPQGHFPDSFQVEFQLRIRLR